ncbi:MAG: 30S ribosomal protein THX [Xanthomonadales bacterium]|nr:30S ribosomal protein THX [Xanthomonadales bacterium]
MGKGDKKSRRGKIFRGSYGNVRPQGSATAVAAAPAPAAAKPAKPAAKTAARKKA